MDYTNENGPELTDSDVDSIVTSLGMPFDQGMDARLPIIQLKCEMFLSETKSQSIISASDVRDLLLDIMLEIQK